MFFKKILFAVDNSDYSRKGIQIAAALSGPAKAPVVLLHVLLPMPSLLGGSMREKLEKQLFDAADTMMDQFKTVLEKDGIPTTGIVAQGDAADEILAAAKAQGCDIIVMGARGHGGLGGFILGSVSQKVLHYSEIPVLIAR